MCYRKLDLSLDRSIKIFGEFTLERALCGISGAGFKFVELASMPGMCHHVMPEQMSEKDFARLELLLGEYGLKPMSLSGHVNIVDQDPKRERKAIELLKKRIELAARLDARIVNTRTTDPVGTHSKKEIERFYDNIKGIVDYCRDNNVVVAIENDGGLTVTADKALEVMKRIDSEYMRINYDTGTFMFLYGLQPAQDLEKMMKYVAHMHVKDQTGGKRAYNFPAIGDGDINFQTIFDIVKKHGFKGPFSVETGFGKGDRTTSGVESAEETDEILQKSYNYLRRYRWLF